ncbi:MAG: hypothetical protein ACE5KZ_05265 [Candidatus Scalinduaceae bacterium]
MKRRDWLEHEIILKVLCRYFQKSKDKLDSLHKQIRLAGSVLINVDEFKKKAEERVNQNYSQWEDWYAELQAVELLKKEGFNEFKSIKEGSNKTPDFEAKRRDESALIEVKHKHFSDDDKIFNEFDRKLCAESIRHKILRKSFVSNFQKIPEKFKQLLENQDKWQSFIDGLKDDIKAGKERYINENGIKIDWLEDFGEFSLSDQLQKSLIPRPRFPVCKEQHNEQIEKLYDLIKVSVKKAISQIEEYEKTVDCKFDIKYVIYFISLNTETSLFASGEAKKKLETLKNEINWIHTINIPDDDLSFIVLKNFLSNYKPFPTS